MKNIKWLLTLASRNPLIFSLALLMIAVSTLSIVVANRDKKINSCDEERQKLLYYYNQKLDSMDSYYKRREYQLNEEVKLTLKGIVDTYKEQLEEQRDLNLRIQTEILKNKSLINKTNSKIKNLQ
jgi:hypothetical protein